MSFGSRVFGVAVSLALGGAPFASAGNLSAVQHGTTLKVKGDALGADVVFTGEDASSTQMQNFVRVIPASGNTVNGGDLAEFTGVTQINVTLGDGPNDLTLEHVEIDKGISVKGGSALNLISVSDSQIAGNLGVSGGRGTLNFDCESTQVAKKLSAKSGGSADTVSLECDADGGAQVSVGNGANQVDVGAGSYKSLSVKTGTGADDVTVETASIETSLKLALGSGANTAHLQSTQVGESLGYTGSTGGDHITAELLDVGTNASFNLGSGQNSVSLENSLVGENLSVVGGSGNDTVAFSGTVSIGGKTKFRLGGGTNVTP